MMNSWLTMLGMAAALTLMACSGAQGTPAPTLEPPSVRTPETSTTPIAHASGAEEGREILLANCAVCHGEDAQGKAGPALPGHTPEQIRKQVRNPAGAMPAFSKAQISDQQLDNLVEYILSLGPAKTPDGHGHGAEEMATPAGVHLHMALIALKNENVADARHHLQHFVDFTQDQEMKEMGGQMLKFLTENKVHDAEHMIEGMLPQAMQKEMTMGSMHLDLALDEVKKKNADGARHHLEHALEVGDTKERLVAEKAIKSLEAGNFHDAEDALADAIGMGH